MQAPSDSIEFGPFRLTPSRRTLECHGQPVALSARAFEILALLIESRDRVVSRDQIVAQVWPGIAVEPSNLTVQMSALRRALGDAGPQPRLIATVPGRGYRFIGTILGDASEGGEQVTDEAGPRPPARVRWTRLRLWGVCALALALSLALPAALWPVFRGQGGQVAAPPLSIVVMPFRDLSDRRDQTYLADAISDDLTTDLARVPGSVVIARETADSYAGRAEPATEIGRKLGVRYLLEGSMRAEQAMLHVNAQLISTQSGAHIWAQRFDVERGDMNGAQETIVRRIASALDVELAQAENSRARLDRPQNPGALGLFFQARSILDHDDSLAGFNAAQSSLERAIAQQPDFADALAELGTTLLRKIASVDDATEAADMREALTVIARALALSPRNTVAMAARGQALVLNGKTTDALYAAREVLAIDPNNLAAEGVVARCASAQGRMEEAAVALQTILNLNPDGASNKQRLLRLGYVRLLQGRIAESIDLLHRASAGDPEPRPGADSWGRAEGVAMLLIAAEMLNGDGRQAKSLYESYRQIWPHRTVWRIGASETKSVARLPGYAAFLNALTAAGMPAFADEHEDPHVRPSPAPLPADDFVATPFSVVGARTIDTPQLVALRQGNRPMLILDLGAGAAVMNGAVWRGQARDQDDASFVDAAVRTAEGRRPVVVLSDGPYGSQSYNAVLALVVAGHEDVFWYRGGEEAWSAGNQPASDLRE